MRLQILLDGNLLREEELPPALADDDEEGLTNAMLDALRVSLRLDRLTPSQALRVKFRVIGETLTKPERWS